MSIISSGILYVYGFRISSYCDEDEEDNSAKVKAVAKAVRALNSMRTVDLSNAIGDAECIDLPNGYTFEQIGDSLCENWASWFIVLSKHLIKSPDEHDNETPRAFYSVPAIRPTSNEIAAFKGWLGTIPGLEVDTIEAHTHEYLVPWVSATIP